MWELRKSEPDHETMLLLANYFGVTVDFLLGRNENNPANNGEAENAAFTIPEKYSGIRVALNEGDKNLKKEDIKLRKLRDRVPLKLFVYIRVRFQCG